MKPEPPFVRIQTQTTWGRTLAVFAEWCLSPALAASTASLFTLDVGCGPGLLPALLSRRGCRAFGADLDAQPAAHRLYSILVQADALRLPFPLQAFDLITASNLLFLLPDPLATLGEMARLLRPGGTVALLNPSEHMNVAAATALADARGLTGLDRESLLTWSARAEKGFRWDEVGSSELLKDAGFLMAESVLKIGPGLARWVKGKKVS